jgi:hypothetical protein
LPFLLLTPLRKRLEKQREQGFARSCAHFPALRLMTGAPVPRHAPAPVIGNRLW